MIAMDGLTYRTIDPDRDASIAYENYLAACIASFASGEGALSAARYRAWLTSRVEEFPDGHVMAMLGSTAIGQLELQVPYGSTTGYINLYAVSAPFRGLGFGRMLHRYVEQYFRSWEVREIELDVAPRNLRAMKLYRSLGYRLIRREGALMRMSLTIGASVTAS